MDTGISTFLNGLKVSPELAAFVAIVIIFLLFMWRIIKFGVDKLATSQQAIADANDKRLAAQSELFERVTIKFQAQLDRFEQRGFDNQVRYQEQLRVLTESHIMVSREHITALAGIQGAFQGQAARLEQVERLVGEIGRAGLMAQAQVKPSGRVRPQIGGGSGEHKDEPKSE